VRVSLSVGDPAPSLRLGGFDLAGLRGRSAAVLYGMRAFG
jgi:hypothetical protein